MAKVLDRLLKGVGRQPATETVHFLHIGKNAGTQMKRVIDQINATDPGFTIKAHGHHVGLRKLPEADRYFFSIRKPDSRFSSAFYSRKRKGQPRIYVEWSDHEARAFADFEHANDLAEALFTTGARGRAAVAAITSINHTARQQIDWFQELGHFLDLRPPVAIVRQECFAEDLSTLLRRLNLNLTPTLTDDPVKAHVFDYADVPPLSDLARANLRRWYARDHEFYALCADWITSNP